MGSFVIEKGAKGGFHFNLQADNNEIVLGSEHYASKQKAEEGCAAVAKLAASGTTVDHA